MRRSSQLVRLVVVAVSALVLLGVSTPPASAATAGTVSFEGVMIMTPAVGPAPGAHIFYAYSTSCRDTWTGKKGTTAAGTSCYVYLGGTYTGNCLAGVGTGIGYYVNSAGQYHDIPQMSFTAVTPVWAFGGTMVKPDNGQTGPFAGAGAFIPTGCPTTTIAITGTFTYTLA